MCKNEAFRLSRALGREFGARGPPTRRTGTDLVI
jgi:hypothetical protein